MIKKVAPVHLSSTKIMAVFLFAETICPICEEDLYIGKNKFGKNTVCHFCERTGWHVHSNECKSFRSYMVSVTDINQQCKKSLQNEEENEDEDIECKKNLQFSNKIYGSKI